MSGGRPATLVLHTLLGSNDAEIRASIVQSVAVDVVHCNLTARLLEQKPV
jgi:hypothetical protein